MLGLQICWGIIYEVRWSIEIAEELESSCFIVLGSSNWFMREYLHTYIGSNPMTKHPVPGIRECLIAKYVSPFKRRDGFPKGRQPPYENDNDKNRNRTSCP